MTTYIYPLTLNSSQIAHILNNQPNMCDMETAKKEYKFLDKWVRSNFRKGECLKEFILSKREDWDLVNNETHKNWKTILDWLVRLSVHLGYRW